MLLVYKKPILQSTPPLPISTGHIPWCVCGFSFHGTLRCIDCVPQTYQLPLHNTPLREYQNFKFLFVDHNCINIWRNHHPITRNYTYYSAADGSHTRINYIWIHPLMLPHVHSITNPTVPWSDHDPNLLVVKPGITLAKRPRPMRAWGQVRSPL